VQVIIKNRTGEQLYGNIRSATKLDLEKVSKNWKFDWPLLYSKDSKFFRISYENEIQGLIKLEEENESYYVLKNIEVAPSNYGSKGKFINIAELLMSFACLKSFELNKGNYKGYLVFTSKGALIKHYQEKYYAELIFREKMIITPEKGKLLIKSNLKIDLNDE